MAVILGQDIWDGRDKQKKKHQQPSVIKRNFATMPQDKPYTRILPLEEKLNKKKTNQRIHGSILEVQ